MARVLRFIRDIVVPIAVAVVFVFIVVQTTSVNAKFRRESVKASVQSCNSTGQLGYDLEAFLRKAIKQSPNPTDAQSLGYADKLHKAVDDNVAHCITVAQAGG
jgi:hypothetical protein